MLAYKRKLDINNKSKQHDFESINPCQRYDILNKLSQQNHLFPVYIKTSFEFTRRKYPIRKYIGISNMAQKHDFC